MNDARYYRGRPNILQDNSDDEVGFICPGCGLHGLSHYPLCPVAIWLTAREMQFRYPKDWSARCIQASLIDAEVVGSTFALLPRHWRIAAIQPESTIRPEEKPATIVWDAEHGVFLEYHHDKWLTDAPKRYLPVWAGKT